MGAREKLNAAYLNGVLVVAGLIAAVFGSWWLFAGLAALLLTTAVHAGQIRLRPRR